MSDFKKLICDGKTEEIVSKVFENHADFNKVLDCLEDKSVQEQIFKIITAVLDKMSKTDIKTSTLNNLIGRIIIDLHKLKSQHLVTLVQKCQDSISLGNPKVCLFFKDLLPAILNKLKDDTNRVIVEGVYIPCKEYQVRVIGDVLNMKWPESMLCSIAMMFKDIELTKDQMTRLLAKLCESLRHIDATEIPALAHQMFTLCKCSQLIIIPLLALNKYFYLHCYKQVFAEMDSEVNDLESIEDAPQKNVRDAEETVIFHFQSVTRFTQIEKDLVAGFKNLAYTPQYILTPFLLGALLSVAKVSSPDGLIIYTQSTLLPFLCQVIKNNEHSKEIQKTTAWSRQLGEPFLVPDLMKIFHVLVENNRNGKETSTEGLVALAFVLLKFKKSEQLSQFGSEFLISFIKERSKQFIPAIIKNLTQILVSEQDKPQIVECFTTMSLKFAHQVSESEGSIKSLMEELLNVNDESVLVLMSIITPLVAVSYSLREYFIEILRKAFYQRNINSRMISVFGFCQILRQLRHNNSRRIGISTSGALSQLSISGYSLMSQMTMSHTNNPNRHFDFLVLEIIGMLQKCFSDNIDVKIMLYSSLERCVMMNPILLPFTFDFIEYHFRDIFDNDVNQVNFDIDFQKIFKTNSNNEITLMDHLGKLLHFVIRCYLFSQEKNNNYDLTTFTKVLDKLLDHIDCLTLEDLGIFNVLDYKTSIVGPQYMNCLEALMEFSIAKIKQSDTYYTKIVKMFKKHQIVQSELKKLNDNKKAAKKKSNTSVNNETNSGEDAMKVTLKFETVWDMKTVVDYLILVFDESSDSHVHPDLTTLRTNRNLSQFVLNACLENLVKIRTAPEYLNLKYSRSMIDSFFQCSKLLYRDCVKNLIVLMENFDLETALLVTECFKECITVLNAMYKRKLAQYLTIMTTDGNSTDTRLINIIKTIQSFLEHCFSGDTTDFFDDTNKEKLVINMFQTLELLYECFQNEHGKYLMEACEWLKEFCVKNALERRNLAIVNKILFNLRMKVEKNDFLLDLALQFKIKYGVISDAEDESVDEDSIAFRFESLTVETLDLSFGYYLTLMKQHIEHIEFFILRMKSLNAKIKIPGQTNIADYCINLNILDRSISKMLIRLTKVFSIICNTDINNMDYFLKVLIQFYNCLVNITKYYTNHHDVQDVDFHVIGYEELIRKSKPLATVIYDILIPHVEDCAKSSCSNDSKKRKVDIQVQKQKLLRETKHIPKLIYSIENFNKWVSVVDQKSKQNLSKYLHFGETRNFSLKSKHLMNAIKRARTAGADKENLSDNENDEVSDGGAISDSDSGSDDESGNIVSSEEPVSTNTSQQSDQVIRERKRVSMEGLMENVKAINKKVRKENLVEAAKAPAMRKSRRAAK